MNMISKKLTYFTAIMAISFLFSLPLYASTLKIESDYSGYPGIMGVKLDGKFIGSAGGTGVGMFDIKYNGYNTFGFCIDLGVAVGFGENNIGSEIVIADNLIYVEWLMDKFAGGLYSTFKSDPNNVVSPESAALQLAIWEVLYEDSFTSWDYDNPYDNSIEYDDFNSHFVYDRSQVDDFDVYGDLNGWYDYYIYSLYNAVTATDPSSLWTDREIRGTYIGLGLSQNNGSVDTQDIIVKVVPEPTTALLLGFGLLGLCAVGRKRA